ncbi:MAG TPA: hypothetical protein VH969_15160 [Actinophytocola sp.]|jgi:exopolyphosphatase/pppGpp-phosphohydrolase|uniref:Ppx/GppA phosphatase family protein n=1 Tax=Actinophytocola sp. TaxID=1872138 RepID=UPI002F932694
MHGEVDDDLTAGGVRDQNGAGPAGHPQPVGKSGRAKLRGVSRPRASQILAGAITAHATMTALDLAELEVSPWALREGIVLRYLSTMVDGQPLPLQPLSRTSDATVTAMPLR